jgi:alkylation response protein AidB-like acyl-CoA dehydrogenase
MYLDLNDEQKMLAQTVRRFVEKECPSTRVRKVMATESAYDEELWNKMAEQGWMGLTVPDEFGGLGESWLTVASLFEELGRGVVPGPFLATVALAVPALIQAGNADQKARWLPAIAEGSCRATVAYLEPKISYEVDSASTSASAVDGKYNLSGTKMFALDADVADIIIVSAKEDGKLGLYLVEKGAAGLKVEILDGMDLTRRLTRITLENTPAEKLDGAQDAKQALEQALYRACFALSAESVGGMQWILDASVAYAKQREQYGRLIGSYQAVAHPLVDRLLDLTSTRSAVYNAAYALDHRPDEVPEAVSMAKAQASDSFRQAGYTGVQTHGGIGFTWEHDMQLYFRRGSANWSLFGDPNWHRERMLQAMEI